MFTFGHFFLLLVVSFCGTCGIQIYCGLKNEE